VAVDDRAELLPIVRRRRFAQQQALCVPAQPDADVAEEETDGDRCRAVPPRLAGELMHPNSQSSQRHARQRAGVLQEHRPNRRILGFPRVLAKRNTGVACLVPQLSERSEPRRSLGQRRHGKHRVGDEEVAALLAPDDLDDAQPDREQPSRDEDEHSGQERPEEPLLPVSEGMILVRGPFAEPERQQQEPLIGGVGDRMRSLGEERRRSTQHPGDPLGDGEREIRAGRDQHGFLALRRAHVGSDDPPTKRASPQEIKRKHRGRMS
jgi:hypothetical protein